MNWFNVVKIIGMPMSRIFLSNIVVNRAEFENTLNKLRSLQKVPSRLQGIINNDKSHKSYYDEGVKANTTEIDLSEEESKEMFDEMLQIMAEKTKEFTPRKYYTIEKTRELLSEAIKAKNSDEKDKVAEIVLEIIENNPSRAQFWAENIPERERLDFLKEYLEETEGKSHLFFENPPSNKKILTDFAEMIGGTVKGDKIFVNFESQTDLVRRLRPSEQQQKEFEAYRANNEGKKSDEEKEFDKRFKFYNKNIRPLKPKLKKGTVTTTIDSRLLEAKELNIRGAKYQIVGEFDERSVFKYIEIVEGLRNSKRIWMPKELANGDSLPKDDGLIFLPRQSGNVKSLILNPYTSIILNSSFGDKDSWFKTFFGALRTNEVLTDDEVEQIIIDDISLALINNSDESRLKIRTASFSRLPKIRNLILTISDQKTLKKRLNEMIRQIISENQGEGSLGEELTKKKLSLRREQLSLLDKYFSIKEGDKIAPLLKEEYGEDDVDILYYDSGGNPVDSKNDAFYVDFDIYGDRINPSNIKEYIQKEIKLTETQRSRPARGLELALKELKGLLEKLPESDKSKQIKDKLRESYTKDIARLEQAIKDRKDKPASIKESENKIQQLRQDLVRPTNFVDYVISVASKESINTLIDTPLSSASSLEQISPKNSLIYLTYMAERVADDVVGEAFNKINDNPNSDEAKEVLTKLNDKIPKLLGDIKTNVIGAFKNRLQFFLDNYGQKFQNKTNKIQVAPALKAFINANMIQEV